MKTESACASTVVGLTKKRNYPRHGFTMQPMKICTPERIEECRQAQRNCRACPPMPPGGIRDWYLAQKRRQAEEDEEET